MNKEQLSLYKSISSFKYVSFDLFDTLIFRTVCKPDDIFKIVEMIYEKKSGNDTLGTDFSVERRWAERLARRNTEKEDITMGDIYKYLPYSTKQKEELFELESQVEINNCVRNKWMVDILNCCVEDGKIIVITTDIYLPQECIENILRRLSIHYDFLFVSSVYGKSKAIGSLYEIVLNTIGIDSSEIVHIGDNLLSDISIAEKYNIEAKLRVKPNVESMYLTKFQRKSLAISHVEKMIELKLSECDAHVEEMRIGYNAIGPLICSFCEWVHEKKKELKVDRIYFVAREGYLVKKCYETLFPNERETLYYLCLNKNIMRLPMLGLSPTADMFVKLLPTAESFTWEKILGLLNIVEFKDVLSYLNNEGVYIELLDSIRMMDLKNHLYDKELYLLICYAKEKIEEQTALLIRYLGEHQLLCKGKVALVNNSFFGNVQLQLQEFCLQKSININILGIQYVMSESCRKTLGDNCIAWLNNNHSSKHLVREFYRDCLLLEHMMFEEKGTACFLKEGDEHIDVAFDSIDSSKMNSLIIRKIQASAMNFVNDYIQFIQIPLGIEGVSFYMIFKSMPFVEDCSLVKNIIDDDIDGIKTLIDVNVPYKKRYLLGGKRIPSIIKWVPGYFTLNGISGREMFIYNIINKVRDNGLDLRAWGLNLCYIMDYFMSLQDKGNFELFKRRIYEKLNKFRLDKKGGKI